MKVVVLGLWHLGCVTAACCAKFVEVIGLDYDDRTIHNLRAIKDADAMVVATELPQLLDIDWQKYLEWMKRPIVVDANGFLRSKLSKLPEVIHRSVGIPKML